MKPASTSNERVRGLRFLLRSVLLPFLLAAVAVISILPFNIAALATWLALLVSDARKRIALQQLTHAISSVTVQVIIVGGIVTAGYLAPGKTSDRFLDRQITLPKRCMTLAELAGDPDEPRPEWLPYSVSVIAPEDESSKVIVFPGTEITLREFVDAIEAQSTIRRRFAHCGNGWTILRGGDCNFGLRLRRPRDWP